jgi:hypothetical protein
LNALWTYYWPPLTVGILIGVTVGFVAFRRMRRNVALSLGAVLTIALAVSWHGPLGAADRFASQVERTARDTLVYYEMVQVQAHLRDGPLTRQLALSGAADDFQRSELVRIMSELPGVSSASWSKDGSGVPLIAEAILAALFGYLLGLLLAYLVGLRRRYNAQWDW